METRNTVLWWREKILQRTAGIINFRGRKARKRKEQKERKKSKANRDWQRERERERERERGGGGGGKQTDIYVDQQTITEKGKYNYADYRKLCRL